MSKFLLLVVLLSASLYLIRRGKSKTKSNRYERKPATPWNALNEGKDPSE